MTAQTRQFDIVIGGGSFVGLALARALTGLAPGAFRIAIVERRPLADARAGSFDGRSAAITASVKAMLEAIGVWPHLESEAQPVVRIELTDSSLPAPIRPTLLDLDSRAAADGKPTAFIVENTQFRRALFQSLDEAADVTWFSPAAVTAFDVRDSGVSLVLDTGQAVDAKLLVAADGQASTLRQSAGIQTAAWDSDKVGIVATLRAERPHGGRAWQHFLPAGPIALLPMTGNRVSLVWTEDRATAAQILAQSDDRIVAEIERRAGHGLGALKLLSRPSSYPLTMTLAREFVRPRFALAGDAAHGLHWIAGQGLNHGLKDVAALAETLIDASRLGLDIGSLSVLRRYERWRRFDSTTSAFTALALNKLFSNDAMALRLVRSSGLRAANRLAGLKRIFMREAAGLIGDLPKLLRGEPV